MRRLLPKSLIAQMALLIGLALLVAQLVNFALILNERQKVSLAQNQGPAITRFASVAADFSDAPAEFKGAVLEDASRRGARFALEPAAAVGDADAREARVEARLTETLAQAGVTASEVRAASRTEARPPRARVEGRGPSQGRGEQEVLVLSARVDGGWLNGRLPTPRGDPWLAGRLGAATLILYVIVLGMTLLVAMRLARPLRDLTRAAEAFHGRSLAPEVEPRGPADLRRAIDAFNAMNRRVTALLDEKDRMLGAIGHDLRTPLASLRIRAEGVEPAGERERMVATIEEMNAMLEDILVLARSGRAREEARPVDLGALVEAVAEEFHGLGQEVTVEAVARVVAPVQPVLLRRAMRNLIDNALKYGGSARVTVAQSAEQATILVSDGGPGLAPEEMERVLEPFYRAEESRSRETGGSGLGLAIARAIAESHGGALSLANGNPGLIATITLPKDTAH
ncbi:MAG TPA: ATP-binding protein [Allosphingosinicella sp.]